MTKTFKDYARNFVENLDVRKSYRWAAGAFAGLALGLAVETYRDPFVNLDSNSPVAPIVRDVFENGKKGEKGREKDYSLIHQFFGKQTILRVEIPLDEYDHPTGGMRLTEVCSPVYRSLGPETTLDVFNDLDGNGDEDGEDKNFDKRYEGIVGNIKEDIKYRKMAEAVSSYVERYGKLQTQWEPFFPRIPILSFLGANVPTYKFCNSDSNPLELNCTLDDGDIAELRIYSYGVVKGYPPDFVTHKMRPTLTIRTSECVGRDIQSTGHEEAGDSAPVYRKNLEKVANSFGIKVDD